MVRRGIHLALYEDGEGIKLVFRLRIKKINIDKVQLLRGVKYMKAPEEADPAVLTEFSNTIQLEPEDIINGVEFGKSLEPEDM